MQRSVCVYWGYLILFIFLFVEFFALPLIGGAANIRCVRVCEWNKAAVSAARPTNISIYMLRVYIK